MLADGQRSTRCAAFLVSFVRRVSTRKKEPATYSRRRWAPVAGFRYNYDAHVPVFRRLQLCDLDLDREMNRQPYCQSVCEVHDPKFVEAEAARTGLRLFAEAAAESASRILGAPGVAKSVDSSRGPSPWKG